MFLAVISLRISDGCRKRKSKCVLQESQRCVLCEFHKQECTFVEGAQPRKRKLEDPTRSDSVPKRSPKADVPKPPVTQQPIQAHASTQPTITQPRPIPPPIKRSSIVDQTLSLQRHRHCKYIGRSSVLDASLLGLANFGENNETVTQVGDLRKVTENDYFSTHADADIPIPDDEARALLEIEETVGQHGPALIDVYFRNVHPSFPIIQKQVFLDRLRHSDRQFNPPLLAAMYLHAMQWWSSEPKFASHSKPDSKRLEYIAVQCLTIAMQRPKISAVQAALLLLQRPQSSAWTLTVQLVALAQDIGLHLDCSDWSISLWEIRLRKRLAWAVYLQDKWTALMYGRPSHISPGDWAVESLTTDDFDETTALSASPLIEDSETTKGQTIFTQMIELTSIMSEVCTTFYTQGAVAEYKKAGRYGTQLVLNRAKPVQIKLREWFAKLPAECKMDSLTPNQLSSTGYLHLAYFATEISIHRRIVQSLDAATSDPYMLYICRSAAKTRLISAMDFVNRLKPEHLNAYWYFASTTNFALIGTFGALLQATSPGLEEADFYASRLREFRWSLCVSTKRAEWVSNAVSMLDANVSLLGGLVNKPSLQQRKETPLAGQGEQSWRPSVETYA